MSEPLEFHLFVLSAADHERLRDYVRRVIRWLDETPLAERFPDAIYTWQVGRTAMKRRLAVKVGGPGDLRQKLQQWLVEESAPSSREHSSSGDRAAPALLESALLERDLDLLGQLWISGINIDWRKLHAPVGSNQRRPRRIRVPTYPFARQRHWIDAAPQATQAVEIAQPLFFREQWQEAPLNTATSAVVDTQMIVSDDVGSLPAPTVSGERRESRDTSRALRDCVLADIRQLTAAVVETPPERLEDTTNLADYGFDSIHLANLSRRLTVHFGVEVTPVVFFSYPTIQKLCDYLVAEHPAHLSELYRASSSAGAVIAAEVQPGAADSTAPLPNRIVQPVATAVTHAEPVAVVGMSGRFPQARTADELWTVLAQGRSAITEIPQHRWNWRDYFVAPGHAANRISTNRGGFIESVDEFDPLFFEISPREAQEMDPAERLLLMEAYRAIEDAGLSPGSLAGSKVGVFVGMEEGQYESIVGRQSISTSGAAMISSRLSYFLDLRGPALATNTACSSGLVALHQAVMSLRQHECEAALVAGVSLSLTPTGYVTMSQAGMLSPDGQCHSFSRNANGIGVGEAVVVLMLKPLSKAIAAGDPIYGVVKASGINFDGKTNGVTAPNGLMQAELIESIYRANDIDVGQITHIVAHGTGTPLGDPVEITALCNVFRKLQDPQPDGKQRAHCAVTSCKSNVGHTLAASGLVSVVGLLKGMQHHQIPPTLSCEAQSDYIAWTDSPFYINKMLRDWKRDGGKPHAGAVSSFGRSGTNAHVVIEEYLPCVEASAPAVTSMPKVIIPLSAQSADQRRQGAAQLVSFIQAQAAAGRPIDLQSMAYTLQTGRQAMSARLGFIVSSIRQLQEKLQAYLDGKPDHAEIFEGSSKRDKSVSALFGDEEDLQPVTNKWIAQGKLSKLLEAWVNGIEIDWGRLYADPRPRRISLPTYPFARERYWALKRLETETLEDAAVRAARLDNTSQTAASLKPQCFEERWVTQALNEAVTPSVRVLVCLLSDVSRQQVVREQLASCAPQTTVVFVAQRERGQERSAEECAQVLREIRKTHGEPDGLWYLWPLEQPKLIEDAGTLVQWLKGIGISGVACGHIVLAGQCADDRSQAHLESWIGLQRSVGRVLPRTPMQVVMERAESEPDILRWIERLWLELSTGNFQNVLYEGDERQVCRIDALADEQSSGAQGAAGLCKPGGTYWVTGGAGGLGALVSAHLARKFRARLVLSGRGALDETKRRQIQTLEALGASVLYGQADVSDEPAMRGVLAQALEKFGRIDGVIHAAGIADTHSLLEKNVAQFRATLTPKIRGALVLEAVLEDQPLDFVCYFSSAAAVLGDFGSGDYAMGNRFLMAHARMRQARVERGEARGTTVAIGWPLWAEGGMQLGAEQTRLYLESSGQRALQSAEGLELFEALLGRKSPQPLVLVGQPERVERFVRQAAKSNEWRILSLSTEQAESASSSEEIVNGRGYRAELKGLTLEQCVTWDLTQHVHELLQIPRERIEALKNLTEYGFESISLRELAARLSAHFGFELSATVLFSHPTLSALVAYLLKQQGAQLTHFYQAGMPASTALPVQASTVAQRQRSQTKITDKSESANGTEPIAIIGLSGRFPGARTLQELWAILRDGKSAVQPLPAEGLEGRPASGSFAGFWLGAVPGAEEFDPLFFEISPREAQEMDPRQRLLLQEAWRALEDAGYGNTHLQRHTIGMFVGAEHGDYQYLGAGAGSVTANHEGILAARLAYLLNLHGPVMAINTACSSGLVAAHQACLSLRAGECDTAIAAGVNVLTTAMSLHNMKQAGMLSAKGQCRAFDREADGMVAGEAVVAVVLKRLSQAQADGDPIHAVIVGSGINYDGKTHGITAPNGEAQRRLLREVYARYSIDPNDLQYIVTHGTGTPLGDPIEINALREAFQESTQRRQYCALTSSKSNLGHTLAAAGLVSLASLVQAMRHETIPASVNCEHPSDYIEWQKSPFYVNRSNREWPARGRAGRLGAVSAFGMSGTNAHVVVRSYEREEPQREEPAGPVLLVLSAKTAEALRERASELRALLQEGQWDAAALRAMSYTLLSGRHHFKHRNAVVIQDRNDALYVLGVLESEDRRANVFRGQVPRDFVAQKALGSYGEELLERVAGVGSAKVPVQEALYALADMYCQGYELGWEKMFGDRPPLRIGLPTYPFARKRYWADSTAADSTRPLHLAPPAAAGSTLHALLHRNTSDLSGQRYTSTFTGTEIFLKDHQVLGKSVLPAVAYLEMARAALEQAVPASAKSGTLELHNIVWIQPFVARAGRQISISLFEETPGNFTQQRIGYEIHSEDTPAESADEAVTHCQGQASFSCEAAPSKLDIAALERQMGQETFGPSAIYAAYRKMGLNYGPAFQGITSVRRGGSELLARLSLPAVIQAQRNDFSLHPSLMDGALQSAIVLFAPLDQLPEAPWLPFELSLLRVIRACESEMLAWVRNAQGSRSNDSSTRLDIDLCDLDGNVCVQMRGFVSRAVSGEGASALTTSMVPFWSTVSRPFETTVAASESSRILVLGAQTAEQDWVRQSCPQAELLCLPVGASIDAIRRELEDRSFDQLMWIAPDVFASGHTEVDGDAIIAAQEHGVLTVFRIVKALLAGEYATRELQWTLITRNTQQASRGDAIVPAHAGISGLIGSLAKEYPHWKLRLLDVDDPERVSAAECLALTSDRQGNGYAHRRGEWFRQELARLTTFPDTWPVYREQGVYVVIGGAGGLGEVWSRHLIEQYGARVVWIGRRKLDAAIQSKIDSLQQSGVAPLYISADAANAESLRQALGTILKTYPRIDGVVHSALVLKDQTVMGMDESRFRDAIRAKVDISVNMDRVFGALDLDFMLFFSSMMSFLKAAGQCNYAAGCTFKDSFAQSLRDRRAYPVKIMNWGYWGSVGIVADDFYRKRMQRAGIGSIDPEEGLRALQTLLGADFPQMAFYKSLDEQASAGLDVTQVMRCLPGVAAADLQQLQETVGKNTAVRQTATLEAAQLPGQINEIAAEILASTLHSLDLHQGTAPKPADWLAHRSSGLAHGSSGPSIRKLAPFYERWLATSVRYLQQRGPGAPSGASPEDPWARSLEDLWREWERCQSEWSARPDFAASIRLLEVCLKALPDILSGLRPAPEIIFPGSSMRLVEGVYKGNVTSDYYNKVLGVTLSVYIAERLHAQSGSEIRILEVGAGTGGTTAILLPELAALGGAVAEYCYTDISKAFLLHAEQHYQPLLPAMTTAIFDVSKPVECQSVTPGRYDVVIATNVLHATPDIRGALRNAKALLRKGGLLLLNELSTPSLFTHLTFGLLEGWWLYSDAALRLPGSPVLAPQTWARILADEGFSSVFFAAESAHRFGQQVIAASSDGMVRQPMSVQLPIAAKPAPSVPVARSADTGTASLRQRAISWLVRLIAAALKMSPDEVSAEEHLEKYGLDSILVVQLTNQLRAVLPDITSTLFFEVRSVAGLADYLLENQPEGLKRLVLGSEAESAVAPRAIVPAVSAAAAREPRSLLERHPRVPGRGRHAAQRVAQDQHTTRGIFDVAIIGCSGRYPQSPDLRELWSNLARGVNCISEIPADRWSWEQYFDAEKGKAGKIYTRWGGFLRDIDKFDPLFFRISPREAKGMDPQERLFLECCYHAIEDSGYTPEGLGDHEKIGVFVGVMNARYNTQPLYHSVANRVSYQFDFQGPSMAVDTACSSSLTAIHLALESLYSGLTECAIAGGVNLVIDSVHYQELSALTMLSAGNQCRSFADSADGFVDAEGVGAVILKPLWKAEQDGDQIYGVIKGSAINAGGKTNGYTVPNPKAQARVVSRALERAGVAAQDVSYIEAHGTGTALGDPIEIAGLTRAFRKSTDGTQFCAIGSLKSNIGHCESAAGIAGLTKVLLQLKHRMLVPSLHCEVTNPEIDFSRTPFRIQTTLQEWKRTVREVDGVTREMPRTAGISSFGAGGANAHIVVQEYVPAAPKPGIDLAQVIIPLSARTPEQLKEKARDLLQLIRASRRERQLIELSAVAYTLQAGRESLQERLAFVTASIEELERQLEAHVGGMQDIEGGCQGQVKRNKEMSSLHGTDEELQIAVDTFIREGKLAELARLWAKGLKLDWNRLYGERRPCRISLPVYPFARERYWRERVDAPHPELMQAGASVLHPLLHRNVSDIRRQRYSSTFRGSEQFLSDHRVVLDDAGAQAVIPAMVYLEMARAAIENATSPHHRSGRNRAGVELYNIVWADPVVVTEGRSICVALFARGSDELAYEIYSSSDDAEGQIVHCQGRAFLARERTPARMDIAHLKSQMRRGSVDPSMQYSTLSALGVHYGPTYRCIKALYAAEEQLLAELRMPDCLARDAALRNEDFVLHPVMMDGALQAASGLIPPANPPSLPMALESLCILDACAEEMFVWVRRSGGRSAGQTQLQLDIDFCDRQGQVCIQMRGLTYEQETDAEVIQTAEQTHAAAPPDPRVIALSEPQSPTFARRTAAKPGGISLTIAG